MIFERSQFKKVGLAFSKLNPLLPFFCGVLGKVALKHQKFHGRIFLLLKYSYLLILYKKHQAIMLSENRPHTLSVSFACKKQPPEVFCKKLCFLKISQNSQESTCSRAFFFQNFLMNFVKFLRTTILKNICKQLLLACIVSIAGNGCKLF